MYRDSGPWQHQRQWYRMPCGQQARPRGGCASGEAGGRERHCDDSVVGLGSTVGVASSNGGSTLAAVHVGAHCKRPIAGKPFRRSAPLRPTASTDSKRVRLANPSHPDILTVTGFWGSRPMHLPIRRWSWRSMGLRARRAARRCSERRGRLAKPRWHGRRSPVSRPRGIPIRSTLTSIVTTLFRGACENVDLPLATLIVLSKYGYPSGVRVHPTQTYPVGGFGFRVTSSCKNGKPSCINSGETSCPATLPIADCGYAVRWLEEVVSIKKCQVHQYANRSTTSRRLRHRLRTGQNVHCRNLLVACALHAIKKTPESVRILGFSFHWLRGQDLNLRPSGYEPDELPGCSTAQPSV